jgi:hypothetical protein
MRTFPAVHLLLLLLLLTASAAPAAAEEGQVLVRDRIQLDNGKVFEGVIDRESPQEVVLVLRSSTGGTGRMTFPRERIAKIERNIGGSETDRPTAGAVRDDWQLLRSAGTIVGARHLVLKHVRSGGVAGWRVEELIEHFPRGPQIPAARSVWTERVDLAFRPLALHFREIGEASLDPDGPRRYERILSGSVRQGVWEVLVHEGGDSERRSVSVPPNGRARLGTREHLLRRREVGLQRVEFVDESIPSVTSALAGYTALDVVDDTGRRYDEFVWEEAGERLVSRYRQCEVLHEEIANGVIAVPATSAQVEAARAEATDARDEEQPGLVRLAEVGLSVRLPDQTWNAQRSESSQLATGWRRVATLDSRLHMASVRVEWDPDGVAMAPAEEEAAARLLQRLTAACPDLRVTVPRRALALDPPDQAAWRMEFTGTLKGERVRTIAVVVDQGRGRAILLVACPEVSWQQASRSLEALVGSIRRL